MNNKTTMNKLWGSAFSEEPSKAVIAFTAGRDVFGVPPADIALLPYDVWVNKAHCVMLAKQGIIPIADAAKILHGLTDLEMLVKNTTFTLDPAKEDVHTNIESWLTEKLGIEIAGKLHTARSRNDQVAVDCALYLKDQALAFMQESMILTSVLIHLAKEYETAIVPGFTHHQHAMVTTVGHIFAGFASMVLRDAKKFSHWLEIHNTSPLGSVVAYGTTHPIDPSYTATLLGLAKPAINSLDAIMNRWEAEADLAYPLVSLMNHLSSIAQTLILWATPEFGMISLADQYSTGSSIMPQKKNPDPLEVMKAKTSVVHGQLMSLLGIGKANFIGYNRDSQWTKYLIMDMIYECQMAPSVLAGVLETMTVNKKNMAIWCTKGFIGATTIMEQLVTKFHLPMRQAKIVVEKAVKYSEGQGIISYESMHTALKDLHLDVKITVKDVDAWQHPETIISLTQSSGGPGKAAIDASLKGLSHEVHTLHSWLKIEQQQMAHSKALLEKAIVKIKKGNI
ncbi:MAG: argininosuccinate lyase [Candidatus Gottesmanbacteria bacterium]